jgi:hypothetical protein
VKNEARTTSAEKGWKFKGFPDYASPMRSKSAWGAIVSAAFAIVLTVTPIPAGLRSILVPIAWAGFVLALVGWYFAPFGKSQRVEEHVSFISQISERKINPRVDYDEKTRIIEIFKNAPRVKVAISTLSAREGEKARPALESAAWLKEALLEAGVVIEFTPYGNPETVPEGTSIFWNKNAANNEMAARIIKAAEIKGLHPREVTRPVSKKCEIELMIGLNPYDQDAS